MNQTMDIEISDIVSMVSINHSYVKGPLAISFSLILLFTFVVSDSNFAQISLGNSNSVIDSPTLDSCLQAVKNPDTVPALFLAACLIFAPDIYRITGDITFIYVIVNAVEGISEFP
ncbi:hypothetical protein NMY3_00314 [Candidatus Nitrosocosmicus oleophilus]|jgi:hypothetical protein|uniref:Uncharacterized protein n=2 Tax=Candidatus Nitrosocosmicus oleophilus TaxID=1353260 RepID=A0A654LT35_9ARCH|nr:hypothetical protein NMY3_00314 [Candidatus Nitrosocosmicus oleophilus]